jgi:hypothetical protein
MQEVLLQQVTQQGDNLHFVALAAAQMHSPDIPDMAKSLMQDLEVGDVLSVQIARLGNRLGTRTWPAVMHSKLSGCRICCRGGWGWGVFCCAHTVAVSDALHLVQQLHASIKVSVVIVVAQQCLSCK